IAVFFARMVMPRSRSNSLESITLSACASLARQVPLWFSMASTSVVLPWSTCAMMAMLRRLELKNYSLVEARASYQGTISQLAEKCLQGTALYQGTTSVVPYRPHNQRALAPAGIRFHPPEHFSSPGSFPAWKQQEGAILGIYSLQYAAEEDSPQRHGGHGDQ